MVIIAILYHMLLHLNIHITHFLYIAKLLSSSMSQQHVDNVVAYQHGRSAVIVVNAAVAYILVQSPYKTNHTGLQASLTASSSISTHPPSRQSALLFLRS